MTDSEINRFLSDRQQQEIGIKSAMIEYAALQRGLEVTRLTPRVIVAVSSEVGPLAFSHMNGPCSSEAGRYICDAKDHSRNCLQDAGLSVAESAVFHKTDREQGWEYAQSLEAPVVVKPTSLSRGRGISLNVTTREGFDDAWAAAVTAYEGRRRIHNLLVEKQVWGDDYRFFVVPGARPIVQVTLRRRPSVVGNGGRTIQQLIRRKNRKRARNPYLAEHPIPTDSAMLDRLIGAGLDMDYVPVQGERVWLRSVSNLSGGGDSVDYTDRVHPQFRQLALRAVEAIPGVRYAGVDIITDSVQEAPQPGQHIISEVEYSPAPITHFPWYGKTQDMAGAIIDFYQTHLQPTGDRAAANLRGLLSWKRSK